MFTDRMATRLVQLLTFLNNLRALPFKVETSTGKLYVDQRSHSNVIQLWLFTVAYVTFVLPTHLYDLRQSNELAKFNFTIVIWISCLCCSLIYGIVAIRPHGICQLLNGSYKLILNFQEIYMANYDFQKDQKFNRILELGMFALFCVCCSVGILVGLDCLVRPQTPAYPLYGVDKRFLFWPIRILASVFIAYIATGCAGVLGFAAYNAILFSNFTFNVVRNEMRLGRASYKSSKFLRVEPLHFVKIWRSLQILLTLINSEVMYNALIFMQGLITSFVLFAIITLAYESTNSEATVQVFMAFTSTVAVCGWSLFLVIAGFQYQISKETMRSWKRENWLFKYEWLYIAKFKKSCKPFWIGDGRRYIIKPITVLIFLRKISRNTFRAMCTVGKSIEHT